MSTRALTVALRKESVDRNIEINNEVAAEWVALRKESVDRNFDSEWGHTTKTGSLSARRAWIEIPA